MTKKEIFKMIAIISAIVVICLGLTVYSLLPELSDFRNSIYGTMVVFFVLTGIILYVTLSKRINMPTLGQVTVWTYLGLHILLVVIDLGKIEALFLLLYAIFNIAVTIYIYRKTGKEYKSIWAFGTLSYLSSVVFAIRVQLINDDWWLTIVIPSIIVAVVVLIPCLIYGIKQFKLYRDWKKLISVPLLGVMVGFLITFLTISSMNVYLDTSNPTYEEFVIIDKDIRAGARQLTTYELEVQKGEKNFYIGVSEEEYYDYEITDAINLSRYSGAFNEPYYIYENNDN